MDSFGDELRLLRKRHGLTQQALADLLGGELSRTTIANVETKRQAPSTRLWTLLQRRFPDDAEQLADLYETARSQPPRTANTTATEDGPLLGGYVTVERYDIIYNFRDSEVPEEIIELRHVRATRNGAHDFALTHSHTGTDRFQQTTEVLFGGALTAIKRQTAEGKTLYTRRVSFDRVLGRGDHHAFGVRYWVERDPVPPDSIGVEMTIPAHLVVIHANFWGSSRPASIWHYGPLPDQALLPGSPTATNRLSTDQTASAWFDRPAIGSVFGLGWRW